MCYYYIVFYQGIGSTQGPKLGVVISFVWKKKWSEIRLYTDSSVLANVLADCQGPGWGREGV